MDNCKYDMIAREFDEWPVDLIARYYLHGYWGVFFPGFKLTHPEPRYAEWQDLGEEDGLGDLALRKELG